jgi:hypothetical protein
MRRPETKTVSGSTFEGDSRISSARRSRSTTPGYDRLIAAGYTCKEDVIGAIADELMKVAGLNRREADAALAALGS